jgi:drug/metabolite transporter (DMT)-like permease
MGYIFLFSNILLVTACQVILKWRLNTLPQDFSSFKTGWQTAVSFAQDGWMLFAVIGTFLASGLWIAALTKIDLSFAYPFSVLSYIGVIAVSHYFLHEQVTPMRLIGVLIICVGIVVITKS